MNQPNYPYGYPYYYYNNGQGYVNPQQMPAQPVAPQPTNYRQANGRTHLLTGMVAGSAGHHHHGEQSMGNRARRS